MRKDETLVGELPEALGACLPRSTSKSGSACASDTFNAHTGARSKDSSWADVSHGSPIDHNLNETPASLGPASSLSPANDPSSKPLPPCAPGESLGEHGNVQPQCQFFDLEFGDHELRLNALDARIQVLECNATTFANEGHNVLGNETDSRFVEQSSSSKVEEALRPRLHASIVDADLVALQSSFNNLKDSVTESQCYASALREELQLEISSARAAIRKQLANELDEGLDAIRKRLANEVKDLVSDFGENVHKDLEEITNMLSAELVDMKARMRGYALRADTFENEVVRIRDEVQVLGAKLQRHSDVHRDLVGSLESSMQRRIHSLETRVETHSEGHSQGLETNFASFSVEAQHDSQAATFASFVTGTEALPRFGIYECPRPTGELEGLKISRPSTDAPPAPPTDRRPSTDTPPTPTPGMMSPALPSPSSLGKLPPQSPTSARTAPSPVVVSVSPHSITPTSHRSPRQVPMAFTSAAPLMPVSSATASPRMLRSSSAPFLLSARSRDKSPIIGNLASALAPVQSPSATSRCQEKSPFMGKGTAAPAPLQSPLATSRSQGKSLFMGKGTAPPAPVQSSPSATSRPQEVSAFISKGSSALMPVQSSPGTLRSQEILPFIGKGTAAPAPVQSPPAMLRSRGKSPIISKVAAALKSPSGTRVPSSAVGEVDREGGSLITREQFIQEMSEQMRGQKVFLE